MVASLSVDEEVMGRDVLFDPIDEDDDERDWPDMGGMDDILDDDKCVGFRLVHTMFLLWVSCVETT